MNKLPRDIILIISNMHPLLIPPFTNKTLRRAVKDYLAGGDRKKRIVEKYGEISNWDVSKQFRGKVGSDGFEKVLIGTRGARETLLRGRKGRAAKNSVLTSGAKQLKC